MSHFTYAPLPIAEVISERPTANLRWNNGILEQEWARETHSPHKAISHEWRVVPTVEHSPDANHHKLGEIGEQFVKEAIRVAYDQGYNDARTPLNLPRDNAPGYRGREKSEEISTDALARLRRLSPDANSHVTGWQDVSTAPKTGEEFIGRSGPEWSSFSCFWDGSVFVHYDRDDGYIAYTVTEWMPFPPGTAAEDGR